MPTKSELEWSETNKRATYKVHDLSDTWTSKSTGVKNLLVVNGQTVENVEKSVRFLTCLL